MILGIFIYLLIGFGVSTWLFSLYDESEFSMGVFTAFVIFWPLVLLAVGTVAAEDGVKIWLSYVRDQKKKYDNAKSKKG